MRLILTKTRVTTIYLRIRTKRAANVKGCSKGVLEYRSFETAGSRQEPIMERNGPMISPITPRHAVSFQSPS